MIALLLALAVAPWSQPLSFSSMTGWQTGASGNTRSVYVGHGKHLKTPLESTAWIATRVRYVDDATADPPNKTLARLPANAIIVWAVIYRPTASNERSIRLDLRHARHLACCDGPIRVAGGVDELTGCVQSRAYSVIVRVYYGSRPTRALRARAQQALNHLRLPSPR